MRHVCFSDSISFNNSVSSASCSVCGSNSVFSFDSVFNSASGVSDDSPGLSTTSISESNKYKYLK